MATPHINAEYGDFAKVVLMPGDPKRAEFIAKNYLTEVKEVCNVRGILGFTGLTKNGVKISLMASGMGMPSIGIYSTELFTSFGVETIIRIGTCGGYQSDIELNDVIVAMSASTDSNWMGQFGLCGGTYSATANYDILSTAVEFAKKNNKRVHVGNVLSADVFYDHDKDQWKRWASLGVLAVEMETYALYQIAAEKGKKALGIFTCSDSFVKKESLSSEQRQTGLTDMFEIAIATAEKFA